MPCGIFFELDLSFWVHICRYIAVSNERDPEEHTPPIARSTRELVL